MATIPKLLQKTVRPFVRFGSSTSSSHPTPRPDDLIAQKQKEETPAKHLYGADADLIEETKPHEEQDFVGPKAKCAVFTCGYGPTGALGLQSVFKRSPEYIVKKVDRPMRVGKLNPEKIRMVAAGLGTSLFATRKQLYGCGLNNYHQLGGKMKDPHAGPTQFYYIRPQTINLPNSPKILSISAGRLHSLVGTSDGLYAFGDNAHGQCGQDPAEYPMVSHTEDNNLIRVNIPSDSPIVQVQCTLDSSFVLLENGDLYAFGLSTDGQLGTGCMDIEHRPQKVPVGEPIKCVHGSADTLLAVSESGRLYIWGQVEYGQLSYLTDSVQIAVPMEVPYEFDGSPIRSAAATATSCIISTEQGNVYSWGTSFVGAGPQHRDSPRPLLLDQMIFAQSNGKNGEVRRVFAGISTVGAITYHDQLFTWGCNRHVALALSHDRDQHFPLQVFMPMPVKQLALGPDHTIVVCY